MPTKAFFRLSNDKQEAIMQAAVVEFSTHLFEEASINQIIKTIDMPRGSFYLYFENKEDLYFYLIGLFRKRLVTQFECILEKNKGNLIDSFIDLYDFIAKKTRDKGMQALVCNIFLNMNSKHLNFVLERDSDSTLESIFRRIDTKKMNVQNDFDLHCSFRILMTLMVQTLAQKFMCQRDEKKIRETYIHELHMLKKGLYR